MNGKLCQLILGLTLIVAFIGGCGIPAGTAEPTPFVPTSESISTPTVMVTHYPQPDLSARPLIFFGPLPPPDGSLDFMSLFEEKAPWFTAADRVQVFNLYGGWVAHFPWEPAEATDEELLAIITDMNRRGIAFGFEAGPLVATGECGQGIEGFFGPEEGLAIVNRLKRLGATVSYVSLDEPFAFGHIYDGPNACQWPPEKIARQVQTYIAAIKSVYPDAIVGDNEPLWKGVNVEELVEWLDAYKAVTGSNLPFIHLDLDYSRADWHLAAKQLEDAARARGIEFGIFYLGDSGASTDAEWMNKAFERVQMYELVAGGRPDHIKFQSWHDRPDRVLPETDPDTFTALINRYFRTRTVLSLNLSPKAADGSINVTGTLADVDGQPLTDGAVQLTIKALDGPGLFAEYTITGTVPTRAIRSDVGFRVNNECDCSGTSDFVLYEARYTESEEAASRVPNSRFAGGLKGWGSWGDGTLRLEANDQGSGLMLHVQATPDQSISINSTPFNVTPGATFTLTFVARISPASFGTGYFDITFQDAAGEFKREIIQLDAAVAQIGIAEIGSQGDYSVTLESVSPGNLLLEANYAGTEHYWPAYTSMLLPTDE